MRSVEITIKRRLEDKNQHEPRLGGTYPITIRETDRKGVPSGWKEETINVPESTSLELRKVADSDPKAYGKILGQAIFQGRVRDHFTAALTAALNEPAPLRLWLVIEDPEAFGDIRWRRLSAPIDDDEWVLLALNQNVPFSLYLPRKTDRPYLPLARRDLRAVLLVSSPSEDEGFQLSPFDVESTSEALTNAMKPDIQVELLATVKTAAGPPTLDCLMEQLTETRASILHLVCHGRVHANGETELFLTGANGRCEPVSGSALISRLRLLQHLPHFAFLSACASARPTEESALGGLAQCLVSELGIKAVVAMTEPISIETAGRLSSKFYKHLVGNGEPDLALVLATAGLDERPDSLVPALYSSVPHQRLFDEKDITELSASDVDFGLTELWRYLKKRAPSLLQPERTADGRTIGLPAAAAIVRAMPSGQRTGVPAAVDAARQAALAEIDSVCMESLDISFASLASGVKPPPYDDRPPFRGLSPFCFDDRKFFCGRDEMTDDLRKRLLDRPFLAILGRAGSGKSSLVFAGLIPRLKKADRSLVWASFRPGETPIDALNTALAALPDRGGLLVADQFEDVFTDTRETDVRREFFDRLLEQTARRQVLITMRAEFTSDCAEHAELGKLIQDHHQLIPPMSADELRHAIESQANTAGLQFETVLAATIIENIRDQPGAMPLLQYVLHELWKRRHGRWLKASEYQALGGVNSLISTMAETVYRELTMENKENAERLRNIFLRLTRLDDDSSGRASVRATHRPVPFRHLVPKETDSAEIRKLINELQSARLVVVTKEQPPS